MSQDVNKPGPRQIRGLTNYIKQIGGRIRKEIGFRSRRGCSMEGQNGPES
jgi:hypothetical protein